MKMRVLKVVVGLCMMFATGFMCAAAPSEDKPTYESLLAKMQYGYLEGNDVGPTYMEIIEKNFGLAGLERLYKDIELAARMDEKIMLFRGLLYSRIEGLKKSKNPSDVAVPSPVCREAVVSEERRDELIAVAEAQSIAVHNMDISASQEFRKELIEAIKEKGWGDPTAIFGIDLYPKLPIDNTYRGSRLITGKSVSIYNLYLTSRAQRHISLDQAEAAIKEAVELYKIHFMPLDENFKDITFSIIEEIKNNKELAGCISSFKIKPLLDKDLLQNPAVGIVPKIIIYCVGKESAQKALNILYEKYKDQKGSGQHPPFNEKVTDLIYYSQGHRDDKMQYPQYYEQPDMVYFFPTVTGTY